MMRLLWTFLVVVGVTVQRVQGTCQVLPERCSFPFRMGDTTSDKCVSRTAFDGEPVCPVEQDGSRWAQCNGGCFEENGDVKDFGLLDEEARKVESNFCKTKLSACIFPFVWNGVQQTECQSKLDDEGNELYKWCPTVTDQDGNVVEGFIGKCDMSTCGQEEEPKHEPAPTAMMLQVTQDNVTVDLVFEQNQWDHPLRITGEVTGLAPGLHGFHVHEFPVEEGADCDSAGGHYNPFSVQHGGLLSDEKHVGDFGNLLASDTGVAKVDLTISHASILDGSDEESKLRNILGKALVIHQMEDDMGEGGDDGSLATGNSGPRIFCSNIKSSEWDLTLIIIIALIVVICLLVLIIVCLVIYCCCCKKKSSKSGKDDLDGLPYLNGDTRKKPLYDELSIPFIDASPAPTPKTGRSTERLSFFRSSSIGRSRGSLSGDDKVKV